jgi:putative isomerase
MSGYSRRGAMTSALAAGVSVAAHPALAGAARPANRTANTKALLDYFRSTGPKLLSKPQGLFKHPTVAPTLPGTEYSTSLWDWDTLWTVRGLFGLAAATRDTAFRDAVATHAKGSLFVFFDNQAASGRLPIIMASTDKDANRFPFDARDRNQAKPVMGQLALLIAQQTRDARWFAPLFDKLVRFHDSWLQHNQGQSGLIVWSNDVAIGNDNDPTTFGRPPF